MLWKTTVAILGLLSCSITGLFFLPYLIRQKLGMPLPVSIHDPVVQQGLRPSAKFGMKVLESITKEYHGYNSDANLRVRRELVQHLKELQTDFNLNWGCTQPDPFGFVLQDPIDMCVHEPGSLIYYESNNVVVTLAGTSNTSLLVSSHFDSAIESYGATDDGVAVAGMVSVLHALSRYGKATALTRRAACFHPLPHSIVFNFNNGEELGMLGAAAFTLHPLFKMAKAFVNLDGTGVSGNHAEFLFRTNSFAMVSALMKSNPFPHSSIIANNVMRMLHSDTDYRPYSSSLPGADYAFYSYRFGMRGADPRYLYHSSRDDIDHTSSKSLQHLASNLLASIYTIVNGTFLERIAIDADLESTPTTGTLPIPSFLFFDRFGTIGVSQSSIAFLLSIAGLVVCVLVVALLKLLADFFSAGSKSVVNQTIKPSLNSFLLVLFSFTASLLVSLLFSVLKTAINPGSTYGNPELVSISTAVLCLATFSVTEIVWPRISQFLRLSRHSLFQTNRYEFLPDSEPLEFSDSDQSSTAGDDERSEVELAREPLLPDRGEGHSIVPATQLKSKVLSTWFPIGILVFWMGWLVFAFAAAMNGVSVFYFFFDFALFAFCTLLLSLGMDFMYRRSLHGVWELEPTPREKQFRSFYEDYFWIVQIALAGTVPTVFMSDLFQQLLVGIPSVIGEGISDTVVDMLLSFLISISLLNFMPVLSQTDRSKSAAILFGLFAVLWLPQLFLWPYSIDRPFKYDFSETWNITTAESSRTADVTIRLMSGMTVAAWYRAMPGIALPSRLGSEQGQTATFHSSMTPNMELLGGGRVADLIQLHGVKIRKGLIEATVVGSPGTRMCVLGFSNRPANSTLVVDSESKWSDYPAHHAGDSLGTDSDAQISVYRRNYASNGRISVPFALQLHGGPIPLLHVSCQHQMYALSSVYIDFLKSKPDWTLNGISPNQGGRYFITKTFSFDKA
ncbi:hypothetical protein HDU91_007143 [Kappamyces sp. JEL0680]|nr:hypothetical protein HDU91_007143 [Kappamyces sp. JEL0680]